MDNYLDLMRARREQILERFMRRSIVRAAPRRRAPHCRVQDRWCR